jgi:hypothetical protein
MNEHVIQSAFSLFCLLPLFLVSLPILFVVQETMLPDLLERSRAHLDGVPRRSLLVGLINGLFFLVLAVILGNSGVGLLALLGLLLTLALLLLTVVGLGVLAGTVGRRVFALWERPASPAARLLVGSVALEALLFVPLVGWLVLIGLGLSGFGAVLLALWRRRRPMVEPKQT